MLIFLNVFRNITGGVMVHYDAMMTYTLELSAWIQRILGSLKNETEDGTFGNYTVDTDSVAVTSK